MKFLVPRTIEGVRKQKERMMRRYKAEKNPQMIAIYEEAINGCDRLTARIIAKARRKLGLLLVLLCLCLMQGCQTMRGALSDSAWILQKTADNIRPAQEK